MAHKGDELTHNWEITEEWAVAIHLSLTRTKLALALDNIHLQNELLENDIQKRPSKLDNESIYEQLKYISHYNEVIEELEPDLRQVIEDLHTSQDNNQIIITKPDWK